jgi:hypothetical protein
MKIAFEVDNKTITELIYGYVRSKLGEEANVKRDDIKIEVQSSQNYRQHTWETGELRVRYEGDV